MTDLGSDPKYETVRDELLSRIYERWDPVEVIRESDALDRDVRTLTRWGEKTQLINEDQLMVPDVENVKLI